MEITNEIKAIAPYLGREVVIKPWSSNWNSKLDLAPKFQKGIINSIVRNRVIVECNIQGANEWALESILLVLKHLSSITDEDIQYCKRVFDIKLDFHYSGTDNFCFESHGNFNLISGCVQFLQSKGYDLPQHLLGGKTLKHAGFAIYEEQIKN